MATIQESWYCGEMKAEPVIACARVLSYRYVPVDGCGALNRPESTLCRKCGQERKSRNERARERAGD